MNAIVDGDLIESIAPSLKQSLYIILLIAAKESSLLPHYPLFNIESTISTPVYGLRVGIQPG